MYTPYCEVGEEDLVYTCHVFGSGLLLERAIPRLPVIKWLSNEINIFKQELDIQTLFPVKKGERFHHLVELSSGLHEDAFNSIIFKAEKKLAKLTYERISKYFFNEFI